MMIEKIGGQVKRLPLYTLLLNIYFLFSIPIFTNVWRWSIVQALYFIFGVFILFIASLFTKPKRQFQNKWLGFLLLLSFISVFINSFYYTDFTKRFINFSLMCEGFIYVLCGILLYKLVYEYGSTKLSHYPALWLALIVWFGRLVSFRSFSSILVLFLVLIAYFWYKKHYRCFVLVLILFTSFLGIHWSYILRKFECRPYVWIYTIKEIIQYPFGVGFDNSYMSNLVQSRWGMIFRHNDYLNMARDLGITALFVVGGYFYTLFKGCKKNLLFFMCLGFCVLISGQTTMYLTRNVILIIPIFALCEVQNVEITRSMRKMPDTFTATI